MANRYPNLTQATAHPPFDAVADPRHAFVLIDDFVGVGVFNIAGTVAADGRPGVLDLDTATAATLGAGHDANEIAVGGLNVGTDSPLYVAFSATADDAGDEMAVTFKGAAVDFDVGDEIDVTVDAVTASSGVEVVAGEWYTVELVFTTTQTGLSVNGGDWAVTGAVASPAAVGELSFVGTTFIDYVVARKRTARAGFEAQ